LSDRQRERLATTLADQFAVLYDVRPVDPVVTLGGNTLSFTFQGGLTPSDESLLAGGRDTDLREFREHFLRVAADQLQAVVEALVPARVSFFYSAFDSDSRTTNCSFVLDFSADAEREQREAILSWSEQVRRNARDLRLRHAEIRDAHKRLTQTMRDIRTESSERR
jgi:uncharacterized protein YbcI